MNPTRALALIALCSTMLAGCWFYSRPEGDPNSGCTKTTYGVAIASTSSTSCPGDSKDSGSAPNPARQ